MSNQLLGGRKIVVDHATQKSAPESSKVEGRWLTKNATAYIRIPSFRSPFLERQAIDEVTNFRNAQTLVVDVRGNGGGFVPCVLIKSLMDRPYHSWKENHVPRLQRSSGLG